MDISLAELIQAVSSEKPETTSPLMGKAVFIRTVTFHYTGRLVKEESGFLVLEKAAWIADSGQWTDALAKGTLSEVEPFPGTVYVTKASVVDMSEWLHPLPTEQK